MEKGKISSITGQNSGGTIADLDGRTINFDGSSFVGRNRGSLKTGDMVWFERVGAMAINVRICWLFISKEKNNGRQGQKRQGEKR